MVRTKDTASVKVTGGKATRKMTHSSTVAASCKTATPDSNNKYAGGNPYCPRETPAWQKSIACFFSSAEKEGNTSKIADEVMKPSATVSNATSSDDGASVASRLIPET